jgi:hypothetical protein
VHFSRSGLLLSHVVSDFLPPPRALAAGGRLSFHRREQTWATRLLALLLLCAIGGCDRKEIVTYGQWCDYIRDPTAMSHQYDSFRLDRDSVVSGVIAAWDRIIVENNAEWLGTTRERVYDDTLVRKLRAIHFMGAFRRGDTLTFALGAMPSPIVVPGQSQAQTMADEYEKRMRLAQDPAAVTKMDGGTYCLYEGLNVFFARIDVQESDSRASIHNRLFEKLKAYH